MDLDKAFSQALVRRYYFNKVYIGMAFRKDEDYLGFIFYKISQRFRQMKQYGVGLMIYDEARDRIFEPINASMQKNCFGKQQLLKSLPISRK